MWLDEAEKYGLSSSSEESAMRVIVGNKIDLYPREVTEQQVNSIIENEKICSILLHYPLTKICYMLLFLKGKSFASRCSATYFETSAKTGASIDEMFQFILNKTVHLRRDSYRKSPHQRPPLLSD